MVSGSTPPLLSSYILLTLWVSVSTRLLVWGFSPLLVSRCNPRLFSCLTSLLLSISTTSVVSGSPPLPFRGSHTTFGFRFYIADSFVVPHQHWSQILYCCWSQVLQCLLVSGSPAPMVSGSTLPWLSGSTFGYTLSSSCAAPLPVWLSCDVLRLFRDRPTIAPILAPRLERLFFSSSSAPPRAVSDWLPSCLSRRYMSPPMLVLFVMLAPDAPDCLFFILDAKSLSAMTG